MTKMISQTDNKSTVHRNLPAKALLNIALARGGFIVQDKVTINENAADYNRHAKELIEAFIANFKKFKVSSGIITAGPELI
ncbi:MAG TPA: hypothetical protein VLG47_05955 [Candidatus Saccharimonadales bacterium]|nr:hypothetical protein [Candidatus Saccharimonadales bacterium]